jgi:hypothetical protein
MFWMVGSQTSFDTLKLYLSEVNNIFYLTDTDDDDISPHLSRSRTMPPPSSRRLSKKSISSINLDRLKNAKMTAEKAIKVSSSRLLNNKKIKNGEQH